MQNRKNKAAFTIKNEYVDCVRQIFINLGYEFREIVSENNLVRFQFKLNKEDTLSLIRAIPLQAHASVAFIGCDSMSKSHGHGDTA